MSERDDPVDSDDATEPDGMSDAANLLDDDGFDDEDALANERELEDEMALYEEQLAAHPEYAEFLESENDIFATCVDASGREMSPHAHIQLHMILERQIRSCEPACVHETMDRLLARGDEPHAAQHAMLRVLAAEMWSMLQGEKRAFDEALYCEELKKL